MNNCINIFFLLLLFKMGYSQNLVLNPSFEEYYTLPYMYTTLDSFFCTNWYNPVESTPDFFTPEAMIGEFGVPYNAFGKHLPFEGKCYIGMILMESNGYVEHISGTLSEKLEKGKKYNVKFYVKSAGPSSRFYAKNIGIKFSNVKYVLPSHDWGFYKSMFKNKKIKADFSYNEFLTDTTWQKIEGEYIANGEEEYFTIGIFYNAEWNLEDRIDKYMKVYSKPKKKEKFLCRNQDVLLLNPNYKENENFDTESAYYFIDKISVELIE